MEPVKSIEIPMLAALPGDPPKEPTVDELKAQLAKVTAERDAARGDLQLAGHIIGIVRAAVGPGAR